MKNEALSIIVPTLNEAGNIAALVTRIDTALAKDAIPYEIVVVDDRSSDSTLDVVANLATDYDIRAVSKVGPRGKAQSLLQGFSTAKHPIVCMIDADLQYPPEAINPMYHLLVSKGADVVISERVDNQAGLIRKFVSRSFNFLFAKLLFGISYDTQSGLKLFRKSVLQNLSLTPSPWSFDLEFLVRALERKRSIIAYPINFSKREAGVTKVKLVSVALEIAQASLKLRLNSSIRKVRIGHRMNSRFLKQAFPTGMMVLLALSLALMAGRAHVSALAVLDNSPITVSQPQLLPADSVQTAPKDAPTAGSSPQPTSSQPSTTTPAAGAAATSASTSPAPAGSVNAPASPVSYNAGSNLTAAASGQSVDTASLTAATAAKPFSVYSNGYPTATISPERKHQLSLGAIIALMAGATCVITAILLRVPIRPRLQDYQILQLSKIHRQSKLLQG